MAELRNIARADLPAILALNDAEVRYTSPLDLAELQELVRMATYRKAATVDGQVAAFLVALREGAPYESVNYRWFAERFPRFLYIDRIVVDRRFARRGTGSTMYGDLFAFARAHGIGMIVCEYNIDPPNPASRAFHDRFGFRELGTQWLAGEAKQVSLQAAETREGAFATRPEADTNSC